MNNKEKCEYCKKRLLPTDEDFKNGYVNCVCGTLNVLSL